MKNLNYLFYSIILFAFSSCFMDASSDSDFGDKVVNIYTDRHYPLDDTLYANFEKEFGIKVNVVKGNSEDLLSRIAKEGKDTKADLLITADVGRLVQAKQAGFFQAIDSFDELKDVDNHLFDEEGYWFGLTKRARVIVYAKDRVSINDLSTYEDLTHSKWEGKIAIRSKNNVYNQSLLASIIAANGEEKALEWVKGIVNNFYQSPSGNDRDQVKAIYMGKADLAIVNTYYIGKMLTSDDVEEQNAAQSIGLFYPNQSDRGAHINVSGAGVLSSAKNTENAVRLIQFLLRPSVQQQFAELNFEFPVHKNVSSSELVSAWGTFKEDQIALSKIGELNTLAIKLFDKGGWK